ncbi:helix-turn-helix domain-containing protein [Actinacidiphila alni]|uniref:helix-turn-helix transcriptional regulator n=1 Tax=Actinacidiphila alni TaxID=380248 RepID=UPI0033C8BFE8
MLTGISDLAPTPDRPPEYPPAAVHDRHHAADGHDSGDLVAVYQYATRRGAVTPGSIELVALELGLSAGEVFSAAARLVELRLLRTDEAGGTGLVPVDPHSAATLLTSPIERAILQQRELADRLRARIDSIAGGPSGADGPLGVMDTVEGEAEIRGLLRLAAVDCRTEAIVLRPGHDERIAPDDLFDACYDALGSDTDVRVLSPHRDRADFASRARAKKLAERGAAIRTIRSVPQTAVVFDRALAVVVTAGVDGGAPTARQVRDETMIRCMVDMFDLLWDGAAPFALDEAGYAEDINDDLQRSIARLMAQGLTDEVVARRLDMSVRTCRRHIAALLRSLGSVSRFQAGVQIAHRLSAEEAAA